MIDWICSLIISSSICINLLENGVYIVTPEPYSVNFTRIYKCLCFYFTHDLLFTSQSLDYKLHHFSNLIGICWVFYTGKNYQIMSKYLMFEMSTPFLSLYKITKRKIFVPFLLASFTYYRVYNCLTMCYWNYQTTDSVLKLVHLCNTSLNLYWYYKIVRKTINNLISV